jgi:hypothetical protein
MSKKIMALFWRSFTVESIIVIRQILIIEAQGIKFIHLNV